jgi:hypothetical protein
MTKERFLTTAVVIAVANRGVRELAYNSRPFS